MLFALCSADDDGVVEVKYMLIYFILHLINYSFAGKLESNLVRSRFLTIMLSIRYKMTT
jgi:hypothetical protein